MNKDHIHRRETKMPWGKFKGQSIGSLPDWYVQWASANYEQVGMRIVFEEELNYRNKYERKKLQPKYSKSQ
jgi:hypothetical protein